MQQPHDDMNRSEFELEREAWNLPERKTEKPQPPFSVQSRREDKPEAEQEAA